jgi:hypothetical protein
MREIRVSIDCVDHVRRPARYAFTHLFLILGQRIRFVREDADVHYGPQPADRGLWLPSDPTVQEALLQRRCIQPAANDATAWEQPFLSLFPVSNSADCPSDIIAAAFYFLSLHEEWTSSTRDQFDRFVSSASLLGNRGESDRPVIVEYARVLRAGLAVHGVQLEQRPLFDGHAAAAVMTHDIDYLSKFTPGLIFREVVKNFLFNRRHVSAGDRMRRLGEYLAYWRRDRDPYVRSIVNMLETERTAGITASWLFKAGGRDKRDVTYALSSKRARWILQELRSCDHDIGLHPSFHAHRDLSMLRREQKRLQSVTGIALRSIRQHYLRFSYPETWRNQCEAGFEVDSTLGFAEQEGFRNGSCHPFMPFDLERGDVLPIWELPLTVMDGTLAHYRELPPEQAQARIQKLLEIVASAGGVAVLLFHNTSYDAHDFPGWGGVFEDASRRISDGRFLTRSMPETVHAWLRSAGYASKEEVLKVINSEPV